ncbi:unnamed protein product [Ostreobium quekettii]|uniref:Uncharacterized protein n=1 Tax=Ostreobium quekettii TaxID=121088 RepID=A0A8S1JB28_9CHLO|nr:unnamed protein product [Ostreobium quekettii]|eukprot:evm.model.scf_1305.2 EVM.evm.TU.scf_1305.2   scf_1305:8711-9736(-)
MTETGATSQGSSDKGAEIFTYNASATLYAMNWSIRKDKHFRLALGSFQEATNNFLEVIQLNEDTGQFVCHPGHRVELGYPATKVMFTPDREGTLSDLVASAGESLRLWRVGEAGLQLEATLSNAKNPEYCEPLTSFDWNDQMPSRLGTASIDTTCTIWDVERRVVDKQLIAHDREVYDIAWGGRGVFATVSADGSVRVFDLRDTERSTIIFESPKPDTPLVRLSWNKQDPRYLATVIKDSPKVVVLDIRYPTQPVVELDRHQAPVNAVTWAPHSSCHMCTAGDDAQALIWDLSAIGKPMERSLDPILSYSAGAEVMQLQWSTTRPDWIAICFGHKAQILRV